MIKAKKIDVFDELMIKIQKIIFILGIVLLVYIFLGEIIGDTYIDWRVNRDSAFTFGTVTKYLNKTTKGNDAHFIIISYKVKSLNYESEIENNYNFDFTPENGEHYKFKIKYCKSNPNLSIVIIPDSLKKYKY